MRVMLRVLWIKKGGVDGKGKHSGEYALGMKKSMSMLNFSCLQLTGCYLQTGFVHAAH